MKKLLLVAALLTLGSLSFANEDHTHGDDCLPKTIKNAYVEIEACVFYPLNVYAVRKLRFGAIEAGETKQIFTFDPFRSGRIDIYGQRGADVKVSWPTTVPLVNDGHEIDVEPVFVREGYEGLVPNGGTIDIPQYGGGFIGKEVVTIGGKIEGTETENAKPGKYEGTLKVSFQYK